MEEQELLAFVQEDKRLQAQRCLARCQQNRLPYTIEFILLAGAWISAGFLIFMSGFLFSHFLGFLGAILAVLAWGLNHWASRLGKVAGGFLHQFALVLGLVGKLVLVSVLAEKGHGALGLFCASFAVAAVSYPLFKNQLDRFVFCTLAVCTFFFFLKDAFHLPSASWQVCSVCVFATALCVFLQNSPRLRALGYALLAACLSLLALAFEYEAFSWGSFFSGVGVANVFLGLVLAAFYLFLTTKRNRKTVLLAGLIFLLSLLTNLCVMMSISLLLVAFFLKETLLQYGATAAFVLGVIALYYGLGESLAVQSFYLLASGGLVMFARQVWVGKNEK